MRRYMFMLLFALLVLAVLVGCGPGRTAQTGANQGAAAGTEQGTATAQAPATGTEQGAQAPATGTEQGAQAPATGTEQGATTGAQPGAAAATTAVSFAELDADKSGSLSQGEFDSSFDRIGLMKQWDTNGDGTIEESELQTAVSGGKLGVAEGSAAATFKAWDTNGDGKLDDSELRAGMFKQLDADSNGQISEQEWSKANLG